MVSILTWGAVLFFIFGQRYSLELREKSSIFIKIVCTGNKSHLYMTKLLINYVNAGYLLDVLYRDDSYVIT